MDSAVMMVLAVWLRQNRLSDLCIFMVRDFQRELYNDLLLMSFWNGEYY